MFTEKDKMQTILDHSKKYLNVRFKILLLTVGESMARTLASVISGGTIVFFIGLSFLFGSFALAHAVAQWTHNVALGFVSVSAFYLLLAIIAYLIKGRYIEKPLTNIFIKEFFKHYNEDKDEQD